MPRNDPQTVPLDLAAMVRRPPPAACHVVPGSTPVVAFGDPTTAAVATLGINPSTREFTDRDGRLLAGDQRRLATLESLGAASCADLTDAQVASVVEACARYFQRRPYRRWFDPLDRVLRHGTGASYYAGTACHLDLVQWATDAVWGNLDDRAHRTLLDDGLPHLQTLLSREQLHTVVLNGRQVLTQVEATGLARLSEVGNLTLGRTTCRLYTGTGNGVRWLGWSANLQSSRGISTEFKAQLADWLANVSSPATPATTRELTGSSHYLPQGLRISGTRALIDHLQAWLATSDATTIGDVGTFGRRPWLHVDIAGTAFVVNADTKRTAVHHVVAAHQHTRQRPWRVVANRNGTVNKLIPGSEPLAGWYAYAAQALDAETTL